VSESILIIGGLRHLNYNPYVTRETLLEMGLDDYRVDTFRLITMILLLMSLDMMPMEPSQCWLL
jgi:hypothetical protein